MDKVVYSRHTPPQQSTFYERYDTYWIKIDISGNVDIKTQSKTSSGWSQISSIGDVLIINDNIPPEYLIETIKTLNGFKDHINHHYHWASIIATIKQLKDGLKENYESSKILTVG